MKEIWQECASFQTTSQRLANEIRTIIKNGCFSDDEILEIHQKIKSQQDSYTISDTRSINKEKQSHRNEPPASENRKVTQPNSTEQTLTHEEKVNLENLQRIMNGEKTTLQRNVEWRTVKTETEKINQVQTFISTNNITELNELIYTRAKLVCKKFLRSPQKARRKKIKTRIGNSTGNANKKIYENGRKW